jgi:taurine dioxygenase
MAMPNVAIAPLTPHIGAVVDGIDLGRLDDEGFEAVHRALLDHLVLFFHDQDITPREQLAFARRFGEVEPPHPVFDKVPDVPEVTVIEQKGGTGVYNDEWHTDVTFRERPPKASILHCQVAPASGGDTLWASMVAAYEGLSEPIKRLVEPLTAVHDITAGFMEVWLTRKDGIAAMQKAQVANPPVVHPVVITHPETGRRALFVNRSFTCAIQGLSRLEGRELLHLLLAHIEQPRYQVRFRWRARSLAIWDNRVTQHYAVNDYAPQHRRMHRVTVIGERPFLRA